MRRSNFATLGYLLLVFVSGAMVGGFANRLYMMKTVNAAQAAPPRNHAELRRRYVQEMRTRLKLTDPQTADLQKILDGTDQHFRELHKTIETEHRQKVFAILTDSQKTEYTRMLEERDRHRRQEQAKKN